LTDFPSFFLSFRSQLQPHYTATPFFFFPSERSPVTCLGWLLGHYSWRNKECKEMKDLAGDELFLFLTPFSLPNPLLCSETVKKIRSRAKPTPYPLFFFLSGTVSVVIEEMAAICNARGTASNHNRSSLFFPQLPLNHKTDIRLMPFFFFPLSPSFSIWLPLSAASHRSKYTASPPLFPQDLYCRQLEFFRMMIGCMFFLFWPLPASVKTDHDGRQQPPSSLFFPFFFLWIDRDGQVAATLEKIFVTTLSLFSSLLRLPEVITEGLSLILGLLFFLFLFFFFSFLFSAAVLNCGSGFKMQEGE